MTVPSPATTLRVEVLQAMGRSSLATVTIRRQVPLRDTVRNPATEISRAAISKPVTVLSREVLRVTAPRSVRPRVTVLSPAWMPGEGCRPTQGVPWVACR